METLESMGPSRILHRDWMELDTSSVVLFLIAKPKVLDPTTGMYRARELQNPLDEVLMQGSPRRRKQVTIFYEKPFTMYKLPRRDGILCKHKPTPKKGVYTKQSYQWIKTWVMQTKIVSALATISAQTVCKSWSFRHLIALSMHIRNQSNDGQ